MFPGRLQKNLFNSKMMLNPRDTRISIVGLGKLGLCLALAFASRGVKVIGVDINEKLIDSLRKGKPMHHEPLIQDFLRLYRKNISFTTDHDAAAKNTNITIVLVSTPSDRYGNFSNKYVESALTSLAKFLKDHHKDYHLVIVSSTLMPGSIDEKLIPLFEKESGLKLNVDFGFTFVPDFVLVGEENKKAGDITEDLYKILVGVDTPFSRIPYIDA
ncbi:MAG: hypothetical protein LN364_02215 [Candidatus Thermoplasmatota archaeon]|nr:hypothetical protein [Candidatus Thermoplasmatota archaeon]